MVIRIEPHFVTYDPRNVVIGNIIIKGELTQSYYLMISANLLHQFPIELMGVSYGVVSLVGSLLIFCGPANVSRFVISIIVDTINRVLGHQPQRSRRLWPPSNVSKESPKISLPLLTNGNASTTIMPPSVVIWIEASLLHAYPNIVL